MNSAPCARTTSPISATGLVLPVAASACTSDTKSISGCAASACPTCSAVTAAWKGTTRSTTSAPQSRSQLPKVWPYGPVTTFSAVEPGRAPPRMQPSRGSSASPWGMTTSCSVARRPATRRSMAAKWSAVSGGRSRKGCVTGCSLQVCRSRSAPRGRVRPRVPSRPRGPGCGASYSAVHERSRGGTDTADQGAGAARPGRRQGRGLGGGRTRHPRAAAGRRRGGDPRRLGAARPRRRALPRRPRPARTGRRGDRREAGPHRPGRRHAAHPGRGIALRHPVDRRAGGPAEDHPGRPAHRPDPQVHPQLRPRDRARRPGRPRRPGGPARGRLGEAGRRLDRPGRRGPHRLLAAR